ncbi:MAG TPA: hypothetical protein VM009_05835 [Terriglobales bacterium]|nr:hypothetical protein [Terriglobales bacterium]
MHPIRTFFKALLIGAAAAWLMFFAGVFITLISLLIYSSITGAKPDLTVAYRIIGAAAGATAFVLGFGGSIAFDIRRAASKSVTITP